MLRKERATTTSMADHTLVRRRIAKVNSNNRVPDFKGSSATKEKDGLGVVMDRKGPGKRNTSYMNENLSLFSEPKQGGSARRTDTKA